MRQLFTIDLKDYNPNGKKFYRPSVRGIIIDDNGNIAMIYSQKYHFYKFPGGGIEGDETHLETLAREIKEETGTITTIETPEIETTTNNGATVTITDTANLPSGEKYIVKSITSTNKGEHILQIYLYSCNNTNIPVTETEEAVKQWVTDIGDDVDYFTYNVRTGYCEGDAI